MGSGDSPREDRVAPAPDFRGSEASTASSPRLRQSAGKRLRAAYIANEFPTLVEFYIVKEIEALRARGVEVVCFSAKKPALYGLGSDLRSYAEETIHLTPLRPALFLKALWLCLRRFGTLRGLYRRILFEGGEGLPKRIKGLVHVCLGVYFALLLEPRGVSHIHAHHGYFASFAAMVAARILGISFSFTLHGSDLLLHRTFLDVKARECRFCVTISEYNRRFLLEKVPGIDPGKVFVNRIGIEVGEGEKEAEAGGGCGRDPLVLLTVGRLHEVKDQAFLVRACRELRERNVNFLCLIVGGGGEEGRLRALIRELGLERSVKLLGVLDHEGVGALYRFADLFVLTSRSEGVPIVLMEAMSAGTVVLAPRITGIPELVRDGETGFLYEAGRLDDFVGKILEIRSCRGELEGVRKRARAYVGARYERAANLRAFTEIFLREAGRSRRS